MKIDDLRKLVDGMTPGPWRAGSVETYHVLVPNQAPDALGPERVLLRMNEHFPHQRDVWGIAELRNHAEPLLRMAAAVKRLPEVERIAAQVRATADLASDAGNSAVEEAERVVRETRRAIIAALADLEAVP